MHPRIPGYRLIRELGSGASARVFLAEHKDLARQVAIKVLAAGLFDVEETRTRFVREAQLQARLSHPHVVKVYDAGFAGSMPFLVIEYVPGGNLRQRLEPGLAWSPARVFRLGAALASGLAHAHQAGIVHRDLKPENILFAEDGQPKLGDFGLAKSMVAGEMLQTGQGVLMGTPGYMAPEIFRGLPVGASGDVFSFACILFETASGHRLFGDGTPAEILRRQLDDGWLLREAAEARFFQPPLDRLVASCLERSAERRPSVAELHGQLTTAAAGSREASEAGAYPKVRATAVVSGLPCRSSSAHAATVVRPSSASAPRRASGRCGPTFYAGVLAVPVLAALGFMALRGGPPPARTADSARPHTSNPSTGSSTASSPMSLPASPPVSVSVGASRARLVFPRPLSSGVRVRFRPEKSSVGSSLQMPAGSSSQLLEPLVPDTAYELEVADGPRVHRIGFRTLATDEKPGVVLLGVCAPKADLIGLASWANSVAVLWPSPSRKGGLAMVLRESADGGQTWSEQTVVSTRPLRRCAWVSLSWSAAGLLAGWREDNGVATLRFRPRGQQGWLASMELSSVVGGPVTAAGAGGEFHVASGQLGSGGKTALYWRSFEPAARRLSARQLVVELPARSRDWMAIEAAGRLPVVFWTNKGRLGRATLWCAKPAALPDGLWSPPLELPMPPGAPVPAAVSVAGDGFALISADQTSVGCWGTEKPDKAVRPLEPPQLPLLPWAAGLDWHGGRLYSAIGYWALFQGGKTPVLIASTEDLRHWRVEGRAVASTAYQLSMRFAVTDTSFLMASQDLTEQHLLLVCRSRQ